MSTALSLFDKKLPAHLSKYVGAFGGNEALQTRSGPSYDVLTIKGKVWRVVEAASKDRVRLNDEHGDPLAGVNVVIVRANPNLSKVFYKAGYEEGSDTPPDCSSNDGIKPDSMVKEPQCKTCAACDHNIWGSGKEGKGRACSDSRRLAVAPENDVEKVMLLRVPAASLRGLTDFGNELSKRAVPYQAVKTRITFDPESASPKLVFKPIDIVSEGDLAKVQALQDDETVLAICGIPKEGSAPAEATEAAPAADDMGDAVAAAEASAAAAVAAKAAEEKAAKAAARKAKAAAAAAEAARLAAEAEEDEDDTPAPAAPAAAAKPTAAATPRTSTKGAVVEELPADLAAMLDGLDVDD